MKLKHEELHEWMQKQVENRLTNAQTTVTEAHVKLAEAVEELQAAYKARLCHHNIKHAGAFITSVEKCKKCGTEWST